jgi:hypothetical protein
MNRLLAAAAAMTLVASPALAATPTKRVKTIMTKQVKASTASTARKAD